MPHNKLVNPGQEIYTDEQAVKDLTQIVAETTSGVKDAIPEDDDRVLAEKIVEQINTRYDHDEVLNAEDFEATGMSGNTVEIHQKSTDQYKVFTISELVRGLF